jgi:hypothetical protein
MPRNTLKSFPTAALRRGMANFHPASRGCAQPRPDANPRGDDGGRGVPNPPAAPTVLPVIEKLEPMPAWT